MHAFLLAVSLLDYQNRWLCRMWKKTSVSRLYIYDKRGTKIHLHSQSISCPTVLITDNKIGHFSEELIATN